MISHCAIFTFLHTAPTSLSQALSLALRVQRRYQASYAISIDQVLVQGGYHHPRWCVRSSELLHHRSCMAEDKQMYKQHQWNAQRRIRNLEDEARRYNEWLEFNEWRETRCTGA
ncbi:hypothetical protein B0T12DRAFT_276637 [Alternaria alternata]|nr:hypothetical protein B0T12DRAFT_276637 [Alternaria alternata]